MKSQSKFAFKPEDFALTGRLGMHPNDYQQWLADRANARLAEMLEDAPVVYKGREYKNQWHDEGTLKFLGDTATHRARLIEMLAEHEAQLREEVPTEKEKK